MSKIMDTQRVRIFVATWNVGGKPPHNELNLREFLHVDDSDIYVLGFQEIVPLNAGNVLVTEDNEPAAKWLFRINQALNKTQGADMKKIQTAPSNYTSSYFCQFFNTAVSRGPKNDGSSMFFQKPSLKTVSKNFRTEKVWRLKSCNCPSDVEKKHKDSCFRCQQFYVREEEFDVEESLRSFMVTDIPSSSISQLKYSLIVCKQMVGIFLTVWARKELVQHIGHLRLSCVGRGIMGCLGNKWDLILYKGCIAVSMSLHQTSFCFICSHLASGEKEGDELRRNSDVIEILKHTQFPKICKATGCRIPGKILEHDRVIWFGDLNYRIALSYSETKKLLEGNVWDALLEKDQLKMEREAGRIFKGWNEGKIKFPPTYKYSNDSDAYVASKKKRRTPAWCDRILWYGDGIVQLSYFRGESRFSDHRPVCAVFEVEVALISSTTKKEVSDSSITIEVEEFLTPSRSYMALRNMY